MGSYTNHVAMHFFQNFDPLPFHVLNSCYVLLWFFEEPPSPLVARATWFVYDPIFCPTQVCMK